MLRQGRAFLSVILLVAISFCLRPSWASDLPLRTPEASPGSSLPLTSSFSLPSSSSSLQQSPAVSPLLPPEAASISSSGFSVYLEDWLDGARNRPIAVKIYMPSGKGPFPVVVFSHGLGGSREAATYLGEYWAAHGYVAVHVQHEGSDDSVWKSVSSNGRQAVMAAMQAAANGRNLVARAYDVKFVLDELERRNKSDHLLAHKVDLTQIAVAGHSFGAGTTLAIAGQNYARGTQKLSFQDDRVKAAIYLSPPADMHGRDPRDVFADIHIPGLLMTGTEDNSPIGNTSASQRRIPFDGIATPGQYLVNFQGGDHMIFGGRRKIAPRPQDEVFQQCIQRITTAFLDATLKGDSSSRQWLDNCAAGYLKGIGAFEHK